MAKRFTVQKRLRMRTNGYQAVEKQFAWDAAEYVATSSKPFRKAETPKPSKPRDLVQDGAGHYRPRKGAHLSGGHAIDRHAPIFHATDWTPEVRLIRAR